MSEKLTFGGFLSEKRKSRDILLKDLAAHLNVSAVYFKSDIMCIVKAIR